MIENIESFENDLMISTGNYNDMAVHSDSEITINDTVSTPPNLPSIPKRKRRSEEEILSNILLYDWNSKRNSKRRTTSKSKESLQNVVLLESRKNKYF